MTKRNATYVELVRNSTGGQRDKGTHKNQRIALDRLAKERGGMRIERIEALGVSGAKPIHATKQGRRLLELAELGFDELRLWDVDRALGARADDPTDRLAVLGVARKAGAVIVDCSGKVIEPESMVGELEVYLRGLFASTERKKIEKRMTAGKRRRAASGHVASGRPPYGYDVGEDRQPVIHEERAEVVREIFARFIQGESLGAISRALAADNKLTARGNGWAIQTIRVLLKRKAYIGEWSHNGAVINTPVIIDRETFHRAQQGFRHAKHKGRPSVPGRHSILVGRVWCPCGRRFYVRGDGKYQYMQCASRRDGDPCGHECHRVKDVDAAVWATVRDAVLGNGLGVFDEPDTTAEQEQVAGCNRQLRKLERAELKALALHDDGLLTDGALRAKLADVAGKRGVITATKELAERVIAAAATLASDTAQAQELLEALAGKVRKASRAQKVKIIAALIPGRRPYGVTIYDDGGFDLVGALATSSGSGARAVSGKGSSLSRTKLDFDQGAEIIPFRIARS